MKRRLDLELRVAATLDCEYSLDGAFVPAVVDKAPDRCHPDEGGAVDELAIVVRDLCVEDEKRDLTTGANEQVRRRFTKALQDLVDDYERRTQTYSNQLGGPQPDDRDV